MNIKTTSFILSLIGSLLLLSGITAAFFGPLEIYCYYLFTEGGRFYYEGFGFGSLMFANITIQIVGYYLIALIFIPLGYGHLKRQSWSQKISMALLRTWLILGFPISLVLLFIFVNTKEPSIFIIVLSVLFLIISYTLLPFLLIKFYKSKNVAVALKLEDDTFHFIRKYPVPILALIFLYVGYIFLFHVFLLCRGIFPLWGYWLVNLPGFIALSISILFFIILIIGTAKQKLWAWWASMIYFIAVAVSTLITLSMSQFSEIIRLLKLPLKESDALMNFPLEGIHLSAICSLPFIVTLAVILFSKKYFTDPKI